MTKLIRGIKPVPKTTAWICTVILLWILAPVLFAQGIRLPYLLGSSSTPLMGSSPDRVHNIQLAVQKISGTILCPGESFSYNKTVGKRTMAAGFLSAPAIVHEQLKPVIGGGICQVSSTLFDAALLSDLKILERYRHYTPINYLPLGMDATVSWGVKDLRFQNSTESRIQIIGQVSDETVSFQIYGDLPLKDELELETEITQSPGSGSDPSSEPGMEIALYRVRSRDDKIITREFIHRDYYPPRTLQVETEQPVDP